MELKGTMYVHVNNDDGHIDLFGSDVSGHSCLNCTCLGTVEMSGEFEMPSEKEVTALQVKRIDDEIIKTRADCQVKIENLEDDKQKLMALESDLKGEQ